MNVRWRTALSVTVLSFGVGLAAEAGASAAHTGHGVAATPGGKTDGIKALQALKGRAFEIAFANEMIVHHRMAVKMAELQLKQGRDARVKTAAQQVIVDQNKEINLLQSWLILWKQPKNTAAAKMSAPGGTSSAVDRWFLTEMVPHHQGALEMAKLVPTRSQNAAVRQLATSIVKTQTTEITQYRAWLKTLK